KPSSTSSNLVVTSKRFPGTSVPGIFCFLFSKKDERSHQPTVPLFRHFALHNAALPQEGEGFF
uniref:hypothetical protein n=1 Tax=Faecalibacterium sp. TaxID=1971605 RepID=UPI004029FF57